MGAVTTFPQGRAWTVADLEQFPENDGNRYELIDGVLVVSPSPAVRHQIVSAQLHLLLAANCPVDLRVLAAPTDVVLADDTVVVPDLIVARRSDFTSKILPVAPLLAVEILSPSNRLFELNIKHDRYRRAGVRSYWIVDPDRPSLTAWALNKDNYRQIAEVSGEQSFTAADPYEVTITPNALLD
ncbi:Uma2 family endonuclease [Microlunatus elymi]|uniref:Uma2 family endonuclease n=1 Tax=Microlunatus elymi TaxID=2596828 RepID=A0A516PZR3_9ACTN|nr:Uma2 family endonuclease [Microlunatus elymi]QDP96675.1 Uma2 family endonuclease [Microlunatus elymi]